MATPRVLCKGNQLQGGRSGSQTRTSSHCALKAQKGPCAGTHLTALPTLPETKYKPAQLRTLLLRRLRLPLQLAPRTCKCGLPLDCFGDHRAACAGVGVLQTRAVPLKGMWRRVCREAGGRILKTGLLRDTNLGGVLPTDNRRLECVADELPLASGVQVAVDCTVVSPLKRNGDPRPRAHYEAGAALADARKRKQSRYPEFCQPGARCKLVLAAMAVGGRGSRLPHRTGQWKSSGRTDSIAGKCVPPLEEALGGNVFCVCKESFCQCLAPRHSLRN